ncbi:hypothetical protein EV128_12592 [Rhizobium azibense]|nr:hypothetical protein EV128_12592 [Rhizobium azibense]
MSKNGIGYAEFDEAYPHAEWEQIGAFETPAGISCSLWKKRVRSPNPPAISFKHWQDDSDGPVFWEAVLEGNLAVVTDSFERARAALAVKPKPNPYANHPNFGRF